MFRHLFLALLLFVLSSKFLFSHEVYHTRSHLYLSIPYHQFTMEDRVKSIMSAQNIIKERLEEIISEDVLDKDTFDELFSETNERAFEDLVVDINDYLEDERVGYFRFENLVPTAFMVLISGKISVNFKIGAGASGTVAFIVVPTKVIRINKITREVNSYVKFHIGVTFFPVIDVGFGVGAEMVKRAGVGIIWGELASPSDFNGVSLGISGSVSMGLGNNLKLGALLGLAGVKNFYAMAMLSVGASANAEVHLNLGAVIPLNDVVTAIVNDEDLDYQRYLDLLKEKEREEFEKIKELE